MADLLSVFRTLKGASDEGVALDARQEGQAAAGQNGAIGYSFKDASGNVVLPTLDAEGKLAVTMDAADIQCLTGTDKVSGSSTEVTVLEIALGDELQYRDIEVLTGCMRDAEFRLVHVNDPSGTPVTTELAQWVSGSGQYSVAFKQDCLNFESGDTSPVLRVLGRNLAAPSDMRATASLKQIN